MRNNGFAHIFIVLILGFILFAALVIASLRPTQKLSVNEAIVMTKNAVDFENKSGLIAYIKSSTALPNRSRSGGDLWVLNPENLNTTEVTHGANIVSVDDWSPDGKKIAVVIEEIKVDEKEEDGFDLISSIAVLNFETGVVTKLKEMGSSGVRGRLFWNSSEKVVYLRSDIPNDNILSEISVIDKSERDLVTLPEELTWDPQYSFDKQWIVARNEGINSNGKIYSYNVETGATHVLTETPAYFGGWFNNKIIYSLEDGGGIWEINPDGTGKRRLVELNNDDIYSITISGGGDKIVYVVTTSIDGMTSYTDRLFVYDYNSKESSSSFYETTRKPGEGVDVLVSKDGKYASFDSKLMNLDSGEIVYEGLCGDSYCEMSWSR